MCRALDEGINWIDTAAVYGLGHAEKLVGEAIKGMREKPLIATKGGRLAGSDGSLYGNLKRDSLRMEVEQSLKRLGVDVIDLYQIHWPDPREDIEEAWEEIARIIEEGKIRYAGVSNFTVSDMERIRKIAPIASVQPPYSMVKRDIETGLLPYCAENNIGVIVYSPMQKGLLTGKFARERAANLPEDDHRRRDTMFQEPKLSRLLDLMDKLKPIASRSGLTPAQMAIAWTLRRPEVTAAIVGARNPKQIEETAPAGDCMLSRQGIDAIDKLLEEYKSVIV